MGLFNRNKPKDIDIVTNAVNLNDVQTNAIVRFLSTDWRKPGQRPYADMFLYAIIDRIFNGMRNVTWKTSEVNYLADDIVHFINDNMPLLLNNYWAAGFACVMYDEKSGKLRLPYTNELRFDSQRRVINRNAVVIYSDPYSLQRKTHFMLIRPILHNIDTQLNNSDFVSGTLGLFGILSSSGMPVSPAAKDELQQHLRKDYGMSDDKYNFVISNSEIKYTPIQIPVDELKFDEQTKSNIKWLCNFFNINPMLIFGDSTFNNQEEAVKSFYRDCIGPLAEVMLTLARGLFIATTKELKPSTIITYNFSNVPSMNKTLSSICSERTAYLEYLLKLQAAGVDISGEIAKLEAETKTMLTEV